VGVLADTFFISAFFVFVAILVVFRLRVDGLSITMAGAVFLIPARAFGTINFVN
jgi:hypothetical protein